MGASDQFTGVALNQSIASKAFTQGPVSWAVKTWLAGNGSNGVKSTQVDPYQGIGNFTALATDVGQRVFFIASAGRNLQSPILQLSIAGSGTLDEYPSSNGPRVSVGAYGALVMRDMATNAEVEQSGPAAALTDGTQYCLEIVPTAANNGKDFVGTLYAASGLTSGSPVIGAQIATKAIALATAVPGTNRRVHISVPPANGQYLTIYGIDGVEAASGGGGGVTATAGWTESADTVSLAGTVAGASAGTFSTPALRNNTSTLLANETGVVVNVYNVATGALVVRKAGLTSNASGVVTVTDPLIIAGTSYAYEVVLAANGRRLPVATAA